MGRHRLLCVLTAALVERLHFNNVVKMCVFAFWVQSVKILVTSWVSLEELLRL